MDVSIIIASFNGREYLQQCLRSIYEHTTDVSFEVVDVDNASTDGTPDLVREEFPQVKLLARTGNAGFSRAINEGIDAASGDFFLILNPDCDFTDNILPRMVEYLRRNRDIGVLGPRLLDADGTLQLSCRSFPAFTTSLFNRYSLLTRLFPNNRYSSRYLMLDFNHTRIADVDWISGACWLTSRAAYEKVGPLDDSYFWTFEDVDYCQRTDRAGLRVVYFPEVSLIHHIGGSSKTVPARATFARHRGMWRYYCSYMQPNNTIARAAVTGGIATAIAGRCTFHLTAGVVRRALSRKGG